MSDPAAADVASWMLSELKRSNGFLYQEDIVYEIQTKFGDRFTYENENGNLAIHRAVLSAFRKLTEDNVVWERGERVWRWREESDPRGRRQAD